MAALNRGSFDKKCTGFVGIKYHGVADSDLRPCSTLLSVKAKLGVFRDFEHSHNCRSEGKVWPDKAILEFNHSGAIVILQINIMSTSSSNKGQGSP